MQASSRSMKKDYIPISEDESALSETSFIEEFWTQKWDLHDLPNLLAERIEKREEFKLMRPYLSDLPPQSRMLDGGCGLGEWTLYFAAKGHDVTGLDLSQATIDKLKERFPGHSFLAGDIRKTNFEEDAFRAYFSWGTFEHFEDGLGKPLAEARRILKAGGYLFISVPFQNSRHLRHERRALGQWDENFNRRSGYHTRMRFYQWRLTRPELMRELEMNGFKVLKIAAIHKWQGLRRTIRQDLHLDPKSWIGKAVLVLLYPLIPKAYAAHMLLAVGQKR